MHENHDTPTEDSPDQWLEDVACPFCALLCDDLSLPAHSPWSPAAGPACPKARSAFQLALQAGPATPMLQGRPSDWQAAIAHARRLLKSARLPLFHGLMGDLLDCRAALQLAAHYGGVVDHLHGEAVARNLAVFQDTGWQVTSLGETRNRADLVVLVADGLDDALPRLREKLFDAPARLHATAPPRVIELDGARLDTLDQARVLLGARPLQSPTAAALALHRELSEASYPVFILGPLADDRAELIVRATVELVRDINETRRAALLALGSGLGEVTAQLSSAWHNGFGLRTGFSRGYPEQDLVGLAGDRLLASGEADLLVWISSLSAQPPVAASQPRIVIGHPAMQFGAESPEIFLPVAIPGVHRAGFLHRADGLRMVPLRALQQSQLPDTTQLCRQLLAAPSEDA